MALTPLNMTLSVNDAWPSVLAQSARATRASGDIWFYLTLLVLAAIVVVIIGLIARKVLNAPIEAAEGETIFDLSDLRRLHRAGQLNDEEFESAKAAILGQSASLLKDPDTPSEDEEEGQPAATNPPTDEAAPAEKPTEPKADASGPTAPPEADRETPAKPEAGRDVELGPELLPPHDPGAPPDRREPV